MPTLNVHVKPEANKKIATFGFDLIWDDETFVFEDYENLDLFEQINAGLLDQKNGRLVVGCWNSDGDREIDGKILKIFFGFSDNDAKDVTFTLENISAKNAEGRPVNLEVSIPDYLKPDGKCKIIFEWIE